MQKQTLRFNGMQLKISVLNDCQAEPHTESVKLRVMKYLPSVVLIVFDQQKARNSSIMSIVVPEGNRIPAHD